LAIDGVRPGRVQQKEKKSKKVNHMLPKKGKVPGQSPGNDNRSKKGTGSYKKAKRGVTGEEKCSYKVKMCLTTQNWKKK